jgi:hypothetical protein
MKGKVVEVKTAQPTQYKNIVTKLCSSTPTQIKIYASEDQGKMERRL